MRGNIEHPSPCGIAASIPRGEPCRIAALRAAAKKLSLRAGSSPPGCMPPGQEAALEAEPEASPVEYWRQLHRASIPQGELEHRTSNEGGKMAAVADAATGLAAAGWRYWKPVRQTADVVAPRGRSRSGRERK